MNKKKYSNYTKQGLIDEIYLMIDNYNGIEEQINNQAKYINKNYIPIKWINKWNREEAWYWNRYIFNEEDLRRVIEIMIEDWRKENE